MKSIIFEINKAGKTRLVNAFGFGADCGEATAAYERALGLVDEKSRARTAEADEPISPMELRQER